MKKEFKFDELWKEEQRERCRYLTNLLIRKGELKRPTNCKLCKSEKRLDCHHLNYGDPKDVIFVCKCCHQKIHNSSTSRYNPLNRKQTILDDPKGRWEKWRMEFNPNNV